MYQLLAERFLEDAYMDKAAAMMEKFGLRSFKAAGEFTFDSLYESEIGEQQ